LLNGRPTAVDPLANLVAAVRAPAQPNELVGLDAALAAFSAAPGVAESPEENIPMLKSVAGRLLALKILAVAAGTAAAGGVAYAAVNGNLDSPNGNSSAVATDGSDAPGSSGADSSAPGSDDSSSLPGSGSETEPSESGSGSESDEPSKSASPSPSLKGLCTAWLAHPRDIAKVSTNPAFSVLIKAAGGPDAVNGYCTALIASAHPTHPSQAQNSSHSKPAHPSQAKNTVSHPAPKTSTHTRKALPTQAQKPTSPPSPSNGRHTKSD
jgi:hypothetical protein